MSDPDEGARRITSVLMKKSMGRPAWRPIVFTVRYGLEGLPETFECGVPMWCHEPYNRLNPLMGSISARRVEFFAWWLRLVHYGTPSEKFVACLLACWAVRLFE